MSETTEPTETINTVTWAEINALCDTEWEAITAHQTKWYTKYMGYVAGFMIGSGATLIGWSIVYAIKAVI